MAQQPTFLGEAFRVEDDNGQGFSFVLTDENPSVFGKVNVVNTFAFDWVNRRVHQKLDVGDLDWTAGTPLGDPSTPSSAGVVPFCLANGSDSNIELILQSVPFCLANGSDDNIELVI